MTDRFPTLTHAESAAFWAREFHKAVVSRAVFKGDDAGSVYHALRIHKLSVIASPELAKAVLHRIHMGERMVVTYYDHPSDPTLVCLGFIQEWDYTTTVNTPCFVGVSS